MSARRRQRRRTQPLPAHTAAVQAVERWLGREDEGATALLPLSRRPIEPAAAPGGRTVVRVISGHREGPDPREFLREEANQ
ncbi:MAG: hypothetical protein WD379_06750 [Dehalococcoidia bacterium]